MAKFSILAICFVIVICNSRLSVCKSVSHIEVNVRPLAEKITNVISHSDIKNNSLNKTAEPTKAQTNDVLTAMFNLFQNIENRFLSAPSNSQIYYSVLRILIFPKNVSNVNFNATGQVPETVTSTQKVPTSTTPCYDYDDDDDSTRPITLLDVKSEKFNKGKHINSSRKIPEVEHGSIQATT